MCSAQRLAAARSLNLAALMYSFVLFGAGVCVGQEASICAPKLPGAVQLHGALPAVGAAGVLRHAAQQCGRGPAGDHCRCAGQRSMVFIPLHLVVYIYPPTSFLPPSPICNLRLCLDGQHRGLRGCSSVHVCAGYSYHCLVDIYLVGVTFLQWFSITSVRVQGTATISWRMCTHV